MSNNNNQSNQKKNFLGYETAEAKCKENYPQIEECMNIYNIEVDVNQCKQTLERFIECFNRHKPESYKYKGQH